MDNTGGDQLFHMQQPASADTVELPGVPTAGELTEALRARRRTPGGGKQARGFIVAGLLGLVLGAALIVLEGGLPPAAIALVAVTAGCWYVAFSLPRMQARLFSVYLETMQGYRAVVDATGVTVDSADVTTLRRWSGILGYVETPATFALFSRDKQSLDVAVLPKRCAQDPADVDRIRALLDRNLKRL
ncbi:YcxB family protein [Streptomyces sp. NPDC048603]|uniref:YcxB family protein n=1 Tax=Streptomyces sp. NPDC048603 TaxID=3365577 RepID=UPI0037126DB3